jgi:MFS family permease
MAIAAFAADGMGVVPTLPTAVADLNGMPWFGWAFSAFMLAWLVGTVAAGLIADARGPRSAMGLGLAAFAAGLVVAGVAQTMVQFLVGRALQGGGGGAMIAAAYVAIARAYADDKRARIMALMASMWILPAVLGPAVAGAVTQWFGWRFVFFGIVPLMAVTAWIVLPPLAPFEMKGRIPALGPLKAAVAVAAGCGLLCWAPDAWAKNPGWAAGAALLGVVLLVPALRRLLPPGTLRAAPGLPGGLAARGILCFSYFGTEAFVPLGLGTLRGLKPAAAGLALTAGALGWIGASWAQDRIEARSGPEGRPRRVGLGFALLAVGICMVGAGLLTALPLVLAPVGWALAGAGVGMAYQAIGLFCLARASAGREGEVSTQLQLAEALSTAAGTGLGGAFVANATALTGTTRVGIAATLAVTLLAALGGLGLAKRSLSG